MEKWIRDSKKKKKKKEMEKWRGDGLSKQCRACEFFESSSFSCSGSSLSLIHPHLLTSSPLVLVLSGIRNTTTTLASRKSVTVVEDDPRPGVKQPDLDLRRPIYFILMDFFFF
jgi:hypothetical protein